MNDFIKKAIATFIISINIFTLNYLKQKDKYHISTDIPDVPDIPTRIINNKNIINVKLISDNYYISSIELSKELQKHLYDTCKKYNVSYYEALAVMKVESNYNSQAIHKNKNGTIDVGLFQINSSNHKHLKEILSLKDIKNPYENIIAGVYMLSKLQSLNEHQRYMAYNQGVKGMRKTVSRGIKRTDYSKNVIEEVKKIKSLK